MIRSGYVGTIIVHQLDRLGETTAELMVRLEEMEKLGVKLISVKEGKQEPGILFDVLGSMAKEYSRQLGKKGATGIGDDERGKACTTVLCRQATSWCTLSGSEAGATRVA